MATTIKKSQLQKLIQGAVRKHIREQREEYPYQGNRSDDSVQKKEYDGSGGFDSKEAEDAYWAERELDEQFQQHRWNKTRKMDADLWHSLSQEDSNKDGEQCSNCEGSGVLGVGLGSKKCFYCQGTGNVPRAISENRISKSQLQKLIQKIVSEQVHGGDFAAWGDEKETPAASTSEPSSAETPKNMPNVGDIFVSNWGYDQTNIDFYKVVAVSKSGGPGVKIVKLGKVFLKKKPGEDYQDAVVPDKDRVISDAVAKRIGKSGSIKINSYAWAYPWDGKPEYQTAAGYGH